MNGRRRLAIALFPLALLAALPAAACKKKGAGKRALTPTYRPYTPIPPPPTRTLRPGEPTQPPRLPE